MLNIGCYEDQVFEAPLACTATASGEGWANVALCLVD